MIDLSRPWPLGLGTKTWWITGLAVLVLLAAVLPFDRQISLWVQTWPLPVRDPLAQITNYGESAWILIPAAALYAITALVALLTSWKLMRTMLWQFAALYAFIFAGVGLPSLFTTLVKRLIGRGRPIHFADVGLFGMHANWADWTYQSFPSGHSTTAFALAAVLGFLSRRWFYPALVLATAVALSRVSLGVHYPTDVLAGAVVGLIGAYAARALFASRGWMFRRDAAGHIHARALASLKRYLTLKRRGIAPARRPDRP
jgi:undecaprenyl-diphosphatase